MVGDCYLLCVSSLYHLVTMVTTGLMSSSQHARRLSLFLMTPPIPNVLEFSKLFSLRMIWSIYDSCCFSINASSAFVDLISSITDLSVLVVVHGIRSTLLHHHDSKLSILLLFLSMLFDQMQLVLMLRRVFVCLGFG